MASDHYLKIKTYAPKTCVKNKLRTHWHFYFVVNAHSLSEAIQDSNNDASLRLTHDKNVGRFEISVKNPVGMKIVNAVENLVEKGFDHGWRFLQRLFVRFRRAMKLDDVPL